MKSVVTVTTAGPGCACRTLVLGLAMLMAEPSSAQLLNYGELEALFGEPVTTSVTGSPQRASAVPATMEIITAEQIRRFGARDLPDVLRHITGVDSLRWSNNSADIGIRGYNKVLSARVLVLVDGRQVYVDHYGYTPWSTLPVELNEIRQIELVKGANSALFGFNAAGGVINIVTYDPRDDDIDFVSLRSGTQDHREASAAHTFGLGTAGNARISAGVRRNETFSTPPGLARVGLTGGEERNSLRLDAHFSLGPTVDFVVEASHTQAAQPMMLPTYTMGHEDMTVRSLRAQLSADTSLGLIGASVYRNWINDDVSAPLYRPDLAAGIGVTLANLDNQMTLMQVQDIFKIGSAHTVRISGEYRDSRLGTSPIGGGTISHEVYSGGAMWNWQIGSALALTNAVRIDHLHLDRSGYLPASLAGFSNADWDRTLSETSYNTGLVWNVSERDVIRLIASRGAQLPNLFDLGGSMSALTVPPVPGLPPVLFITGLPDLEPTTVSNYEIAWDRQFPTRDTALTLALFRGKTHDVLSDFGHVDIAAGIVNAPANIGTSRAFGLETTLDGRLDERWHWRLAYVFEEIDDNFGSQYPEWRTLTNFEDTTPRHTVNASIGWTGGSWEVDAFMRYQSTVEGFRANTELIIDPTRTFLGVFGGAPAVTPEVLVPVSDYFTLDIRAAWKINSDVTLSLSGRNLLHKEQQQTSGLPVERSVLGTVMLEF